jgi:nucleotide-binding universal stress UspA family protein
VGGDHAGTGAVTAAQPAAFHKVLAGTDGSERSCEAVSRGARLAVATGAAFDVVFVIDTHHAHVGDVEREAEAALARAVEAASAVGAAADTRIVAGEPGAALLHEAAEHGADLVAVGPDAGVLGGAIRVGRVAVEVLRDAPTSVLIGREAQPGFPRRIRCGVDGSERSIATAALAARIAAATDAELRLQHVIPVFRGDSAEWTIGRDDAMPPELEPAVIAARDLGVDPLAEMAMGRPEHALDETARRDDVDLLVVGHRGTSGVARILLGSVSEHVARHAHCSVLIARPAAPSEPAERP